MNRFILTLAAAAALLLPSSAHAIQKNVAGQKIRVLAWDTAANAPKTGDQANITVEITKDGGSAAALADTSATELSRGYYWFDLSQAESNADVLFFNPDSSTSDVVVTAAPPTVYTVAPNFASLSVNARGVVTSGAPLSDLDLFFSFKQAKCKALWDAEYSQKWEDEDQTGEVTNSDTVGWVENLADAAHPMTQAVSGSRPTYLASTGSVSGAPCLQFAGGSPIDNLECENTLLNDEPGGAQTVWMVVENNGNGPIFCKQTSSQLERYFGVVFAAGGTLETGTVRGDLVQVGNTAGSNGQGAGEVVDNRTYVISITDTPIELGNGLNTGSQTRLNRRVVRMNGTIVFDEIGMPPVHDTSTDAYLGYNPSRGVTPGLFYFHSLAIFKGELAQAELDALGAMAQRRWKVSMAANAPQPPPTGFEVQPIIYGDSNMEGVFAYGTSISRAMRDRFGPRGMRVPYNLGVFGITVANTDVTNARLLRSSGMTVGILQVGPNSLAGGTSAATTWTELKDRAQSLLAQGVDRIIIWQPTDRTTAFAGGMDAASYAVAKAAMIALMDADVASYPKWDNALDFDANPIVVFPCGETGDYVFGNLTIDMGLTGATNASTDTDWWTEGAHLGPSLMELYGWGHGEMIRVMTGSTNNEAARLASANLDAKVSLRSSQTSVDDVPTVAEFNARTVASATYATASALSTLDGKADAILTDTGTTLDGKINTINTATATTIPGLIGTPATDLATDIAGISVGANPNVLLTAEIAAVNSQTSFTLATGATFDDAYNGQAIVLYDDSNSDYPSVRIVSDYVGSTKTVTIDSAPDFTLATDDSVAIFATAPGTSAPTAATVASAVRTELTTELGRIDAATSTRLATAGYTVPPDSTAIQAAAAAALGVYDPPTKAELDSAVAPLATSASLATMQANVNTINTATGTTIPGLIDALPTAAENATAVSNTTAAAGFFTNQPAAEAELTPEQIEDLVDGLVEAGAVAAPVDADVVDDSRTWFATDSRARNIVTVNAWDTGTLTFAVKPDLNPGTTIASVNSVSVVGPEVDEEPLEPATTGLKTNRAKDRLHFSMGPLEVTGTYTVTSQCTSVDGQPIVTISTLKVQ